MGTEPNSDLSEKEDLFSASSECDGIGEGVFTPVSVDVEGGDSFGFFEGFMSGCFLLVVYWENKERGTFIVFPFSFRVLSPLFWRGVNLDSSLSGLLWGVGTGGVFGGLSPFCLGGLPSVRSEGFVKPIENAAE